MWAWYDRGWPTPVQINVWVSVGMRSYLSGRADHREQQQHGGAASHHGLIGTASRVDNAMPQRQLTGEETSDSKHALEQLRLHGKVAPVGAASRRGRPGCPTLRPH